jgi:hypothetical protein
MTRRFVLSVLTSGTLLSASAADDYFPIEVGNAWNFSYVSTISPAVPNPPTTKDSGTVKWEVFSNVTLRPSIGSEEILIIGIKQTRSLIRRTMTNSEPSGGYDSVFTPPRTTIDTIKFTQSLLAPIATPISFENDTCPFAVHYPTLAMPPNLSSKDTTVSFQGSSIAVKKMIAPWCSSQLKDMRLYSFTLGPVIGPVRAYVTPLWIAGVSLNETWQLINREYPTAVLKGNAPHAALQEIDINQRLERFSCSLNLEHESPVNISLLDVKGCLIKTLFKGNLNAGAHQYLWNSPTKATGVALLRVQTRSEERCVRIMAGIK